MAESSGPVETVFDTPASNGHVQSDGRPPIPSKMSVDDLLQAYGEEEAAAATKEPQADPDKALEERKEKARGKEENLLNEAAEKVKESEKEANAELKAQKEAEEQDKKSFKAQHGDIELDIPEEAVITQEINGKEVPVKVKDAVKAFLGQEEFNRAANARIHQITHRERAHKQEVSGIQGYFKQIVDAGNQGDFTAAMKVIAEMSGQDPVEYEQKQLDQLSEVLSAYTQMDPSQRAAYFAERRAEYLQGQLNKQKEQQTLQQRQQSFIQGVEQVRNQYGLAENEMKIFIEEMLEEGIPMEKITPESINGYIYTNVQYAKIMEGIRGVDEKLLQNEKLVDYICQLTANEKDWTIEDITDVVRSAISEPSPAVQTLSQKVTKTPSLRSQFDHVSSKKPEAKDDDLDNFFIRRR